MDKVETSYNESFDVERPTIDLASTKLTPHEAVKCLHGDCNVILPITNARPCNNLDEYLHKSTENIRRTPKNSHNLPTKSLARISKKQRRPSEPFSVPLARNFEKVLKKTATCGEPSPSMLPSRPKKARHDVFSKTEQIETSSGPLSHLKERLNQVVKVVVRRRRKVPFISRVIEYKGILAMFDKHMNMYLKDVIETFKYQRDSKILRRGRHRNAIILRGDNIILIA